MQERCRRSRKAKFSMFRFIGGAYERNTGKFTIFPPGPPYLLHEKDFEGAQLVRRTLGRFKCGPIDFLTVKEGEMGGAYGPAFFLPGPTGEEERGSGDGGRVQERR